MPRRISASRIITLALTAVLTSGALSACASPTPSALTGPECPPPDSSAESVEPRPPTGATPPPVDEALWALDSNGMLYAVDGRTNEISAAIGLGGEGEIFPGDGRLWAHTEHQDHGEITIIDPTRARIVKRVTLPAAPPRAVRRSYYAHGALWVGQPGRLWRVRESGERSSVKLPSRFTPIGIAHTKRWLWLLNGRTLLRVDPDAMRYDRLTLNRRRKPVDARIDDPESGFVAAGGQLYVAAPTSRTVWRIDQATGALHPVVRLPKYHVQAIHDVYGQLWITESCGTVLRPAGGKHGGWERTRWTGAWGGYLVAALDAAWSIAEYSDDFWLVARLDPATGEVTSTMRWSKQDPDEVPVAVPGEQSLWLVGNYLGATVTRVDPDSNRVTPVLPSPLDEDVSSAVVAARPR